MKRLKLLIARSDFENVLKVLIAAGCVEVTDPDDLNDNDLEGNVTREITELDKYKANQDSITLLGTQRTLLLSGWIPAQSEQELTSLLSEYICAWEIEDPSPDEPEKIPVKLKGPKIFWLFYKGAGKPFTPLSS